MSNYGIDDIKSLDFREGVRTRIQMYLGSDDLEGTYQAFKEIINNSTDEALAGYGKKIEIEVSEKENSISIRDYGRGVPFGIRENGENVLVSIYSKSHTGGKFNDKAYKNSSGLNGVGGSCVCLSSTFFKVESYREGYKAYAIFEKGKLVDYKQMETFESDGTLVYFIPDPEVFKNGKLGYSFDKIYEEIKNISYLYKGITFSIKNIDTNVVKTFCAAGGIKDFVKDNIEKPLHKHIIYDLIEDDNGDKLEIAFQWGSKKEEGYVFVNGLRCPEGGSPITGAKGAITRTFNNLSKKSFDGDSIRNNLFYVINCTVAEPSFANQTKSKINNANLRTLASNCFSNALKDMAIRYKEEFETITELLTKVAKAEAAAERARQNILNATKDIEKNQKKKVFSSDKLKDAEFLGQDSILLIVEGDSAAASMATARDIKKYGILAIRGKILNCLAHPDEKIYQNEEIKLLLSALNITPGKYKPEKLRYGKVAICTDSDSDGSHIGLLIMAALRYLAPEFLEENRLCWLRSPLYIVKQGKSEKYFFNDEEFDKVRGTIKGEVSRAKGLGALSPQQARVSMFSEEFQRMDVLEPDADSLVLLEQLMGASVEPRRKYVFNNIDFSQLRE